MSLRALLVLLLLLTLLAGAVLGPRWLSTTPAEMPAGSQPDCNPLAQTCRWSGSGKPWQLWLESLADEGPGERLALAVEAPDSVTELTVILRGESMYLGEYPVRLAKEPESGHWQARFTVPLCTLAVTMEWRLDLYQGMQLQDPPLQPLRLVFEGPARG